MSVYLLVGFVAELGASMFRIGDTQIECIICDSLYETLRVGHEDQTSGIDRNTVVV